MVWSTTASNSSCSVSRSIWRGDGSERLHGPGRVVATPVEAAVDRVLHAVVQGLEHGRHARVAPATAQAGSVLAEELVQDQDASHIPDRQDGSKQPVGHRG